MQLFQRNISSKQILILILLLAAFLRLFRLDYPNKFIFDEVYHAFTAKEYLAGHKEAWEWWTQPPPGVAYEWTHPPLAKEVMAVSMFIFNSQDGWAWRLPGAILGILSVYIVYSLGIKLLKNEAASLMAAFVFSIDGLNFVQSRTGMNDIYYLTFILLSLLLLLNKRIILSALMLGLALSAKWAAIYAYLLIIPFLLRDRKILYIVYFAGIPPFIYLISYIPFFLLGHSPEQFIGLQQQMWWYHTGLKASHGYASTWWSWPFNLYPVWYFVDYQKNNIANIFASGNPVMFWVGTATIALTVIEAIKKRSFKLLMIILGFFSFWLPWALSPRIMFLYHFSPSVPFLALSLGHQLNVLSQESQNRKAVYLILALISFSFIIIYPFLTGIPLNKELVKIFFSTNLSKNPF